MPGWAPSSRLAGRRVSGRRRVGRPEIERLDRAPEATPREITAKGIAEPVRAHEVSIVASAPEGE